MACWMICWDQRSSRRSNDAEAPVLFFSPLFRTVSFLQISCLVMCFTSSAFCLSSFKYGSVSGSISKGELSLWLIGKSGRAASAHLSELSLYTDGKNIH